MKTFHPLLALFCLSASLSSAQTNERSAKLTGIINLPDFKYALLEIQTSRSSRIDRAILGEGQEDQGVEVSRIDSDTGTVEVRCGGPATTLRFPEGDNELAVNRGMAVEHPTVRLHKADFQLTLELLGELSQRNVLQPSALTPAQISLVAAPASRSEAMKAMAGRLQQQGIATVLEGEKFVIIVPNALTNSVKQWSDEIFANVSKDAGSWTNAGVIPARAIKFRNAPAEQVLTLYAAYSERRFANRDKATPGTMLRRITFYNSTPATRAEVCYAIEMTLACNGIGIVRNEDGSFDALPSVRSGTKP